MGVTQTANVELILLNLKFFSPDVKLQIFHLAIREKPRILNSKFQVGFVELSVYENIQPLGTKRKHK